MKGYLNLTEPGIYEFQALSNDGIVLRMSGQTVLSDPAQHSDNLSNIGRVTVLTAGWYPIIVEYFQRKGTAALSFFLFRKKRMVISHHPYWLQVFYRLPVLVR